MNSRCPKFFNVLLFNLSAAGQGCGIDVISASQAKTKNNMYIYIISIYIYMEGRRAHNLFLFGELRLLPFLGFFMDSSNLGETACGHARVNSEGARPFQMLGRDSCLT